MSSKSDFKNGLSTLEERKISKEIVTEAIKEAMAKAYRKHLDIPDLLVRVEVDSSNGTVHVFQQRKVVSEVIDDELEISLEDAKAINQKFELDDLVDEEVDTKDFSRAATVLGKNILKQKIREAEKAVVYDEYIDRLTDLVSCRVEYVEKDKFVNVKLNDSVVAMMPRNAQIPGETYKEGQIIKAIISEVNKESKGAQILVSRADAYFIKRLFELEVPEIEDGTVEIKAIAREAGSITKMAVYSHNPNVDPLGACIGAKGSRVQKIMDEVKDEKIEVFEWSDDPVQFIKNALSPAKVLAVIPDENGNGLTVIVPDNQLSLAIGKKGKNARLAVRLTNMKIDIKSESDMQEKGIDYKSLAVDSLKAPQKVEEEIIEEVVESPIEEVVEEKTVEVKETKKANKVELTKEAKEALEAKKAEKKEATKTNEVKTRGTRTDYVSKFEEFAAANPVVSSEEKRSYKKKNKSDNEEERRVRLNLSKIEYEVKPEYTQEELEEIERYEEENDNSWLNDDIDFDEYDEYYDQDDK